MLRNRFGPTDPPRFVTSFSGSDLDRIIPGPALYAPRSRTERSNLVSSHNPECNPTRPHAVRPVGEQEASAPTSAMTITKSGPTCERVGESGRGVSIPSGRPISPLTSVERRKELPERHNRLSSREKLFGKVIANLI